ncbi:hypothetical protein VTK56DRAFT_6385 [Thermocarpiscus australiensis]
MGCCHVPTGLRKPVFCHYHESITGPAETGRIAHRPTRVRPCQVSFFIIHVQGLYRPKDLAPYSSPAASPFPVPFVVTMSSCTNGLHQHPRHFDATQARLLALVTLTAHCFVHRAGIVKSALDVWQDSTWKLDEITRIHRVERFVPSPRLLP